MFHAHTTEALLDSKLKAICDCFFKSSVPPQLQIDVPTSMAEQAMEKPTGPYVFRETQVGHALVILQVQQSFFLTFQGVIFKALYSGWKEYRGFSNNLESAELKQALARLEKDIIELRRVKKYDVGLGLY